MNKLSLVFLSLLYFVPFVVSCDKTEKISRDHIPALKEKLYQLQLAVKNKNIGGIDSLMSVEILDKGLSSDSLLSLVYGTDSSFEFTQFGNAEIFYTNHRGFVDCYIMDSLTERSRPLKLELKFDDSLWLFLNFEVGPRDSI